VAAAPPALDVRYRVEAAVTTANASVRYHAGYPPHRGMMTTLCAAVIWGGSVVVVAVGDSRILLIRDGRVFPLLQAETHGVPKSFLGAAPEVTAMALDSFVASDGDRLVLHTDGLDCLSPDEIGALAGTGTTGDAVAGLLRATRGRTEDDVACVVVSLGHFPVMSSMHAAPPLLVRASRDDRSINDPLDHD